MDNNNQKDSFEELKLLGIQRETAETLHEIGLYDEFLWLIRSIVVLVKEDSL
jgi:hypothetical protein